MADRLTSDLLEAIRQFVIGATGLDDTAVIFGDQSAPSPNDPYSTITAISIDPEGVDWQTQTETGEGTLDAKTIGNRGASFSVQFFRGDVSGSSMDLARAVLQYAKTPNGGFLLQQKKLAWREESPATKTDQVDQGNQWEGRAAITLNFGFTETTTQSINSLTSAEIGIEFSGETDISEVLDVTSS